MEFFHNDEEEQNDKENQDDGQNNSSNDDQQNENDDQKDQNKEEETEASLDADYNIDEFKMDEQLVDTDSDKESSEQVIQKKILNNINLEYKIFTSEFDEIVKAEDLESSIELTRLRENLDQQLQQLKFFISKFFSFF